MFPFFLACLLLAAPAAAQPAPPTSPVGGKPSITLTLTDGRVVTGIVLAVNADIYLLSVDGVLTSVRRAEVTDARTGPPDAAAPQGPPVDPAPPAAAPTAAPTDPAAAPPAGTDAPAPAPGSPPASTIPELGALSGLPYRSEPPPPPPRADPTGPRWEAGTAMVVAGSGAAVGGTIAHFLVGPAEDARFWTNPVDTFAVAAELGGTTTALVGAGVQRRAIRRAGGRVNAVALVSGWVCYGVGTAFLAGATLSGSEPEVVNPGSVLVGAGLVLGVVQARVNAGAAGP